MKKRPAFRFGPAATQWPFSLEAALLIALMALASIGLFAMPGTARAAEDVIITGQLSAERMTLKDAVLVVELDGELCLESTLDASGRFVFRLPVGSKARLLFEKPGFKTKEVLVDTRNALNTTTARKANKKVEFAVELEPVEARKDEQYIGPVGYISFVNGTGLMRVRHDGRLVAVGQAANDK
ncbi:MAG: hypothetical protein JNM91_01200 [Flavobacteriales bacterium]|nr:hypothetical protein [Flavobacteriales bacterium]